MDALKLTGEGLTVSQLARAARDARRRVVWDRSRRQAVEAARSIVATKIDEYCSAEAVGGDDQPDQYLEYGITTGFGEFKRVPIRPGNVSSLQRNIILSHSSGVGEGVWAEQASDYFGADLIRATLILRLNTFLKGHSGVRIEILDSIEQLLNRSIIPLVPIKGSVGSSGDLAPLSHLFSVLLGRGMFYIWDGSEPLTSQGRTVYDGSDLPAQCSGLPTNVGHTAFSLAAKEGLALTNGASFSAAQLALAVEDGERLASFADVAAAMSLEAVMANARALDPKIHEVRNMTGQKQSAARIRGLLASDDGRASRLIDSSLDPKDVQDAYSFRCAPQVHGASCDAIHYAREVATAEINAGTDNPLIFPDEDSWDQAFRHNSATADGQSGWQSRRQTYSAGNFHGQPVALAADFLTIALAELASISERRIQTLLDFNHNRGLPGNLVPRGGLNSGFMIAQYTAASLVSENKVLAHPASVDSIPTSSNVEDHVSMASIAARKARIVAANVEAVLAIELMVAAQAIEWRVLLRLQPEITVSEPIQAGATWQEVEGFWRNDEMQSRQFAEALANHGKSIVDYLGPGTSIAYEAIRKGASDAEGGLVEMLTEDRPLDQDIRTIRAQMRSPTWLLPQLQALWPSDSASVSTD